MKESEGEEKNSSENKSSFGSIPQTMNYVKGIWTGLYESRNILKSMVRRNIMGKYRNSYLGIGWQFITPLVTIVLFYVVFTGIMRNGIDDYWAYLCVGMFPFYFMQTNLGAGSGCIASNGSYINKMYFPRSLIVFSQIVSTLIVFLIAYAAIIVLILISDHGLNGGVALCLVPMITLMVLFSTGYVLLLASITVFVRDIQHLIDAISRVFFWVTPVFYMADSTSGLLSSLIWFNPFTYFVECFHNILYWGKVPEIIDIEVCILVTILLLTVGIYVFQRLKGRFAERVRWTPRTLWRFTA